MFSSDGFLMLSSLSVWRCVKVEQKYLVFESKRENVVIWQRADDEKPVIYYMEESVLLGTKPLVDSIRHFIRDPSGVFSVCHLCECRIVQWRHDSRRLLLLNWFLHIIKRTLHVGSKIWILCSRGKNNVSRVSAANEWDIVLATRT